MNWRARLAVLTITLFCMTGCGSTEVESGDPSEQQNDNDQPSQNDNNDQEGPLFATQSEQLATAQCDRIAECCDEGERDFEDADECATANNNLMGLLGEDVEDSYQQDRIDVDDDAIEDCAAALEDVPCSQFDGSRHQRQQLDGCQDVISPLLTSGDSCNRDFECNDGYCDGDQCASLPSDGEPCAGNRCGDGLYCDSLSDECTALLDDGESCGEDEQCESGNCVSEDDGQGIPEAFCEPRAPMCG